LEADRFEPDVPYEEADETESAPQAAKNDGD
jgi:hypothetical protein